jgi:integrase/recombinase XerC
MTDLKLRRAPGLPAPLNAADDRARKRYVEFFTATKVGSHTFRATGITAYLKNDGKLEKAAQMANHASTRTSQLYGRRSDEATLDEVERVLI